MSVATYMIGPPARPVINHDNGFLDDFAPRKPEAADYRKYAVWLARLEVAEAIQKVPYTPHNDLTDALGAYRHFMGGRGSNRVFSYERYVASDPSGVRTLENVIRDAKEGAESLYATHYAGMSAEFPMTSTIIPAGSRRYPAFPYPATENWQKAIGAHFIWVSADVSVVRSERANFRMKMLLHVEDRFNFNPHNKDIATGIRDDENGIFEITGLAKQYTNFATLTREVVWTEGDISSRTAGITSGRERQPHDNRRGRNRI